MNFTRVLGSALVLMCSAGLGGCDRESDSGKPTGSGLPGQAEETVSFVRVHLEDERLMYLPIYYGQVNGIFEGRGLEVSIEYGEGGAVTVGDQADVQVLDIMCEHPGRLKQSQDGASMIVVGALVGRPPLWIASREGRSLISGRVHVLPSDTDGEAYVQFASQLAQEDDGPSAAMVAERPSGNSYAELLADPESSCLVSRPRELQRLEADGYVIESLVWLDSPHYFRVMAVRELDRDAHEDALVAFLGGIHQAMQAMQADPRVAITAAQRAFPDDDHPALEQAVVRLLAEQIIPGGILVSEKGWYATSRVVTEQPASYNMVDWRLMMQCIEE